MSATNRAPAFSQAGRPATNSPCSTHSSNGSVTTAAGSATPVCASSAARSSSVVRGVIRSTMVVTNEQ